MKKSSKKTRMPLYAYFLIVFGVLFLAWIAYGYFGSRVELLTYTVEDSSKEYEIRLLDDHILAEVEISGEFETISNNGFGIIAGYIFGGNKSKQKIAMTSPVISEESEKIAMTAPVISEENESKTLFSFVMPSKYTLENLPEPNDSRIKLKEIKGKRIAVLTFRWWYTDAKFKEKKQELKELLERDGLEYDKFSSAGYNPPWTPPFMRRNEVWAELK